MICALLCGPRGAESEGGLLPQTKFLCLSAPASWLLRLGRGEEGSVKGGRTLPVHGAPANTLDGFRPTLRKSRLKRGHGNEEEI